MLSDEVADEVNRLRRAAGLNRDQLGARCAELGLPLSGPAIANIETGRRDSDGRRRREVTVDELAVLARALGVSPIELAVPLGESNTIDFPGGRLERWRVLRWFLAEGPLVDDDLGQVDLEPDRPTLLLREHYRVLAEIQAAQMKAASARLSARSARAQGEDTAPYKSAAETYERISEAGTARLAEIRRELRVRNASPPDLGRWGFLADGESKA